MKKPRKRVPYTKQSKRNPIEDISTDAGRTAKHRTTEKDAEKLLRTVLGNPADAKGKPLSGHLLATIAANQIASTPGQTVLHDFEATLDMFLGKLTYIPNATVSISQLWSTFLDFLKSADANTAREVAAKYQSAFWWYATGYVHRIKSEYDRLPNAIVAVEIWGKNKKYTLVAVQRDGKRRELQRDRWLESPRLLRAGSEFHEVFAAKDVERIRQIGAKRFVKEILSGKRKLAPRQSAMLYEDKLVNVAIPTIAELSAVRRDIAAWFSLLNKRRMRPSA